MNNVVLIGRLTRDPDVRYSQGNNGNIAIARYNIAVNRQYKHQDGQQSADFISMVAFGKNGEFAEKYLKKGMKIAITGHLQTGSYTTDDGHKVYTTDVIVDKHEFVESKGTGNRDSRDADALAHAGYTQADGMPEGFMNIPDGIDDDLPFN